MIFLIKDNFISIITSLPNEEASCFYFNYFSHEHVHVFSAGAGKEHI